MASLSLKKSRLILSMFARLLVNISILVTRARLILFPSSQLILFPTLVDWLGCESS